MSKERGSMELLDSIVKFVNTHWYPAAYQLLDDPTKVQIALITDHGTPARMDRFARDIADYHGISGPEAVCLINRRVGKCFRRINFDHEKHLYSLATPENLYQINDDLDRCIEHYDLCNHKSLKECFIEDLVDLQNYTED